MPVTAILVLLVMVRAVTAPTNDNEPAVYRDEKRLCALLGISDRDQVAREGQGPAVHQGRSTRELPAQGPRGVAACVHGGATRRVDRGD